MNSTRVMEDVEQELEAMQAMYAEDCRFLRRWPPHVEIVLKPRTADDLSQQFVEAVLAIKANDQYPATVPAMDLRIAKGLDEVRQGKLLSLIEHEASELMNGPMLVTISETAVEFLTANNYPEGECCLCLVPLRDESLHQMRPLLKLISCFHCFHGDCFARWLRWLFKEDPNSNDQDGAVLCPICRALIHIKDIAHVQDFLSEELPAPGNQQEEAVVPGELLEKEAQRQIQFLKEFEAQKARSGIIEVRKLEVIMPGMVITSAEAANGDDSVNEEASNASVRGNSSADAQSTEKIQSSMESDSLETVVQNRRHRQNYRAKMGHKREKLKNRKRHVGEL